MEKRDRPTVIDDDRLDDTLAAPTYLVWQMWFTGEYVEVTENHRLVYTESISDEHGNVLAPTDMGMPDGHSTTTQVTVELEDLGNRTRVTMTHAGVPADSPGATGWTMAFDKLAAHLDRRAS